MGSRRAYGVKGERKIARARADEKASSGGAIDAVLRLQRSAGNRAVAEQVQIARQGTAAPQKTLPTMTIQSEELGTLTFTIRSKFVKPDLSWTISAPHPGSDLELKLRKAQKENVVLETVDVIEGESKANMKLAGVRNLDSDSDGIIFDLVYAGPI